MEPEMAGNKMYKIKKNWKLLKYKRIYILIHSRIGWNIFTGIGDSCGKIEEVVYFKKRNFKWIKQKEI